MTTQPLTFKPFKSLDEQINYLENTKNVEFIQIDKQAAKEILLKYNYINVITPYKHYFAQRVPNNREELLKINGMHIYPRKVDFNEYYEKYSLERSQYPIMFEKISKFEVAFNSIMTHYVLKNHTITNEGQFNHFIDNLKISLISSPYNPNRKDHMLRTLSDFHLYLSQYNSIYIFFDRLSLSDLLTMYCCLDIKLKRIILNELFTRKLSFKISDITTFEEKIFALVSIRNCIAHSNSLEILTRFYDVKEKKLRNTSEKTKFVKLIIQLRDN